MMFPLKYRILASPLRLKLPATSYRKDKAVGEGVIMVVESVILLLKERACRCLSLVSGFSRSLLRGHVLLSSWLRIDLLMVVCLVLQVITARCMFHH